MKIIVKVKPNAKKVMIEKMSGDLFAPLGGAASGGLSNKSHDIFQVSVKEPPVDGRANAAVIRVVAEYFKVRSSQVRIISGATSKQKVLEISGR
ncbi:MAG: hypothetical protein Athens071426_450 [Parcubacteria group bacterium Athens0714_26]|nr:MAG: hypothetical protein Athens101426_47 [Parcubacteria group bacterium Athens1014_26]TSD02603.1 MAG: hypothetical protein Athens071426_450 [Parcubacteria group bacterium Athens0714_26]